MIIQTNSNALPRFDPLMSDSLALLEAEIARRGLCRQWEERRQGTWLVQVGQKQYTYTQTGTVLTSKRQCAYPYSYHQAVKVAEYFLMGGPHIAVPVRQQEG